MSLSCRTQIFGGNVVASITNRWIGFFRNYGPIPTNDTLYDEQTQKALRRHKIEPILLPVQFREDILQNLQSPMPISEILIGTAGDGKTYCCREVWLACGGTEADWNADAKVKTLSVNGRKLVFVKDLSVLISTEN